jgi:hypothetical protein
MRHAIHLTTKTMGDKNKINFHAIMLPDTEQRRLALPEAEFNICQRRNTEKFLRATKFLNRCLNFSQQTLY